MNKEVPYECCGNLFWGRVRKTYVLSLKKTYVLGVEEDLCFRGCGRLRFFGGEEDLCFGDIRKS